MEGYLGLMDGAHDVMTDIGDPPFKFGDKGGRCAEWI